MKIKTKNMDFREKRLVFMASGDVPGAAPAGDTPAAQPQGEDTEQGGDLYEPLRNYYDAAKNTYYDEQGIPTSMDSRTAAALGYLSSEPHATEAPAVAAAPAAERTEVTGDAQAERLKLDTSISLSALKDAMKGYFQAVAEILKGKRLTGEITKGQLDPDFLFIGGEDAFKKAVKEQLTNADIETLRSAFGKVFDLKGLEDDEKFKGFLAGVAAVATLGVFQSTIQEKYPHILTFKQFEDGIVKINYDLNFDPESPALNLSLSSGAQRSYDEYAADEQKKVEEAGQQQQEAATKQAEEQDIAAAKRKFKDQLKKNAIGAFLVDFFDGPGPDGKPGLIDKLFEGKSPILAFLLGALGVGKFKEDYDNVRRLADKNPKLKGLLDQVEERISPYRVDTPEAAETAAAAAAPAEAPGFTPIYGNFDGKKFPMEVGAKRVVGDQGVTLVNHDYTIPTDKKLKVDLKTASLILPKDSSLNILDSNGNEGRKSAVGGKNLELNDMELVLVDAIPKGTIFTKGVKLELVSV